MKLGQRERAVEIETISTGSLGLDLALGVGGLPRGRIVEIYGPESSGKTTLTLQCIAEAQKAGGVCAFVDAEHALDPGYARKLGVNIDELLISQPDTGEQALEIADTLVRSLAIDLVVIDCVAALVPRAEIEGEMGDSHMGLQARLMSQALRKLTAQHPPLQLHRDLHQPDPPEDRRDVRQPRDHDRRQRAQVLRLGAPRHPPHRPDQGRRGGGRQPDPGQGGQEQGGAAVPGGRVRHHVRRGDLQDRRVDRPRRARRHGREVGPWFSYDGQRIGQGRENAKAYLKEHPEVAAAIESAIRAQAGLGGDSGPGIDLLDEEAGAESKMRRTCRGHRVGGQSCYGVSNSTKTKRLEVTRMPTRTGPELS